MIPIGDSPRSRTTPWVTYAFIAANVLVWLYTLSLSDAVPASPLEARRQFNEQTTGVCYGFETRPSDRDRFYCERSFQPQEFFDVVAGDPIFPGVNETQALLSILTSIFMHAGWLHIIGNLLFLWVFGDNVEDRLGHIGYALFYVAGGVFAALCQGVADPDAVIPNVGASGAVAAVLGSYLVLFPRATVNVVIPIFILIFIPIPIPAALMIGIWFLQNLLAGVASVSETSAGGGVAFFAHIGGFAFGFLLTLLVLRPFLRRPPRYALD
ncbi:MAG: rhomboid family intramembrane serine protease [Dehalococcoidia bacterium]